MMNGSSSPRDAFLICRNASQFCGFPLEYVAETMRALPLEPFPEMPSFVLGVSIVRGAAIPVINLAMLLGSHSQYPATRYVTINVGDRLVAFAVESVIGVRRLMADSIKDLPPLFNQTETGLVTAIATLDAELLLVLNGTRCIDASILEMEYAPVEQS